MTPKTNPYVGKIFGEPVIWFNVPQKGVSQPRSYLWTGSGLKPSEKVKKPKTFASEKEALAAIPEVIAHIKDWKSEFEGFIKESASDLRDFRRLIGRLYEGPEPPPGFERAMKGIKWSDYRQTLSGHAFKIDDDTTLGDLVKRFPDHVVQLKGGFAFVGKKMAQKPLPKGVKSSWEDQAKARAKRDKESGEVKTFKANGKNFAVVVKDGKVQRAYRMRRDGRASETHLPDDFPGLAQALKD